MRIHFDVIVWTMIFPYQIVLFPHYLWEISITDALVKGLKSEDSSWCYNLDNDISTPNSVIYTLLVENMTY